MTDVITPAALDPKTDAVDPTGFKTHLEALRNANDGFAITVWKEGSWKLWQTLDAKYSEKDPDWLLTIWHTDIAQYELANPLDQKAIERTVQTPPAALDPVTVEACAKICEELGDMPGCSIADEIRALIGQPASNGEPVRPHKTMTLDEYLATPLRGWHSVCFDIDGFGGVGVRYHGDSVTSTNKT
jgi:hypothetical protein